MAYANWNGIALDRTTCHADITGFQKAIAGLTFLYYAGGGIIAKLSSEKPEDSSMETYQGLRLTDRWYSVRLVDFATRSMPRTGITFGMVTVGYGFEGAAVETNMPVLIGDWTEQGGGDYWLQIGLAEFANYGKYTIRVSPVSPGNFADRSLVVDVIDPTIALDADMALHLGAGVGRRNLGGLLSSLAQSQFARRRFVYAVAPVLAQGIDDVMVAKGCIEYERVIVSYTFNWAAPDYTYDQLYYYNAGRKTEIIST